MSSYSVRGAELTPTTLRGEVPRNPPRPPSQNVTAPQSDPEHDRPHMLAELESCRQEIRRLRTTAAPMWLAVLTVPFKEGEAILCQHDPAGVYLEFVRGPKDRMDQLAEMLNER